MNSNWIPLLLPFLLAPLLLGVIARTKAFFAGRTGPPLRQPYSDIWKLWRKDAVYSRTTTWVFRAGPLVGLAAAAVAVALMPFAGVPSPLGFSGDLVLFAYFLGLMRFFTVLAALDTGSSFEGMGASREVLFSAMAEPAMFLALAAVARESGSLSLSGICFARAAQVGAVTILAAVTGLIVFLTENARIPVDDPATHLELTMIHEVMVLDHGGPDLALILYGAALKLWALGALLVGILMPALPDAPGLSLALSLASMLGLAVLVGVLESSMARLKLLRVPHILVGAGAVSVVALALALR